MRRFVLAVLMILLIVIAAAGLTYGPRVYTAMQVGVGYVAHQMCGCQHIAGRDASGCRADLLPEMSRITSQELADRPGTQASLLGGLVRRTAVYETGAGCTLQ